MSGECDSTHPRSLVNIVVDDGIVIDVTRRERATDNRDARRRSVRDLMGAVVLMKREGTA